MQFIDLKSQYQALKSSIDARIQAVLNHGQFIMGPEVQEVEEKLAAYVGVKHCVTVSSGTTALQLALMALGIKAGDEVITTPFSFFATVETIVLLGAKPVFVDIDPKTYNLDPSLLESAITDKTKAIMPVGLYGQCADFTRINAVAAAHGIPVIEDGAQSFGGTHHGKRSCGLSLIGCTSFFPSKPLGCYGDGGACFTDDDKIARTLRLLVNHGQEGRYNHVAIGINGRFDSIQAAVILGKLEIFDKEIEQRQQVALWYAELLKDAVQTPLVTSDNISAFAQYTIEAPGREQLAAKLKEKGIPTAVHYPKPLHQQPATIEPGVTLNFPHTEQACQSVLSLPFHPYMARESVVEVAEAIKKALVESLPLHL